MDRFAVVTDSTADIPPEIAHARGITVVPLLVSFGEETFTDGDLTQEQFFEKMAAAPELPKTSQPAVGVFVEAYERALATAEQVVSVHISNRLSGTIASARQAAERFAGNVHVFDSLNLSWGLALQVLEAAAAAREGVTVEAALQRLEEARAGARMIVGLDKLDNLAKGGRIGNVSAFLGSLLDLKVTFTVDQDGAFQPLKRVRGAKAALDYTMQWVAEQMQGARSASFAVLHAMSEDRAERLREKIASLYEVDEMFLIPVGSVIATHTGTGWGVALLPRKQ